MEETITDIKKFKLEVFESEDPEGAKQLKEEMDGIMNKAMEKIEKVVEKKLSDYFEKKEMKEPKLNYIG